MPISKAFQQRFQLKSKSWDLEQLLCRMNNFDASQQLPLHSNSSFAGDFRPRARQRSSVYEAKGKDSKEQIELLQVVFTFLIIWSIALQDNNGEVGQKRRSQVLEVIFSLTLLKSSHRLLVEDPLNVLRSPTPGSQKLSLNYCYYYYQWQSVTSEKIHPNFAWAQAVKSSQGFNSD